MDHITKIIFKYTKGINFKSDEVMNTTDDYGLKKKLNDLFMNFFDIIFFTLIIHLLAMHFTVKKIILMLFIKSKVFLA